MSTSQFETSWDFSQVYSLLDTLSRNDKPQTTGEPPSPSKKPPTAHQLSLEDSKSNELKLEARVLNACTGLGDFSQIWQFLGTPTEPRNDVLSQHLRSSPTLERRVPIKIEYTSDGAIYPVPASIKKLQWRDEINDGTLTDVAPAQSDEEPAAKLSKKQRQKRNRRKRMEEAEIARRAASDLESEAEMPPRNPAARASVHSLRSPQRTKHNLRSRSDPDQPTLAPTTPQRTGKQSVATTTSGEGATPAKNKTVPADILSEELANAGRKILARYNSEPPETNTDHDTEEIEKKEWPVSEPQHVKALSFIPASVGPQKSPKAAPAAAAVDLRSGQSPNKPVITPKIIRSGPDRHWAFLLKLIANFYEDRSSLVAPANMTNHSSDPAGIHVFVDASNIFIGFHDQLKRARGIPSHVRVPRVDMSFDALALLMERRRPVAKRVLAGSTPEVAAFDVARRIGYDCAILDKVYKARELTERQRFFLGGKRRYSKSGNKDADALDGYSSENASAKSAGDNVPTHAPQKYVEQGVDEILHLKMMESVVDADDERPPGTMVLATGDAAQAEYSSGFMVMVERALKKGWKVELVSWSANISSAYKRDAFLRKWAGRFRVVELDDYAEELLDM